MTNERARPRLPARSAAKIRRAIRFEIRRRIALASLTPIAVAIVTAVA